MNRIERVECLIEEKKWESLVIDAPIDLYYLTGMDLSLGRLVLRKGETTLFVDGRYFEKCKEALSFPVQLTKGYGEGSAFHQALPRFGNKMAFDTCFTSYQNYHDLEKLLEGRVRLVPVDQPVKYLRAVKEKEEIDKLREAACLCMQGFEYLVSRLKEGVSEEGLALELEIFWLKNGGGKLAFEPIIAFQENTSMPHYRAGKRKLKAGELIQIDIGVMKNHYASDMSRVISFGKPDEKWHSIYSIVREAQQKALSLCRPGILIQDIDAAAREVIAKAGYGEYFPHSLGHGVGLELHELPLLRGNLASGMQVLEKGMVVTIEPGIYLPKEGGVRLEDTIVITDTGYENLTPLSIPPRVPLFTGLS